MRRSTQTAPPTTSSQVCPRGCLCIAHQANVDVLKGYPTLKVFRNGKSYDYEGGREAADIVSYMAQQVG